MLLNSHYRSKLNFSLSKYEESKAALRRIQSLRDRLLERYPDFEKPERPVITNTGESILRAMDDDLDVPQALAQVFEWVRTVNSELDQGKMSNDAVREGLQTLDMIDRLFDWLPEEEVPQIPAEILELVARRQAARKAKDWALADELRDKIKTKGWIVKDTPQGPRVLKI
jgi:cysteinyl-tRNA synthetase